MTSQDHGLVKQIQISYLKEFIKSRSLGQRQSRIFKAKTLAEWKSTEEVGMTYENYRFAVLCKLPREERPHEVDQWETTAALNLVRMLKGKNPNHGKLLEVGNLEFKGYTYYMYKKALKSLCKKAAVATKAPFIEEFCVSGRRAFRVWSPDPEVKNEGSTYAYMPELGL
jgi:hypothetical protein